MDSFVSNNRGSSRTAERIYRSPPSPHTFGHIFAFLSRSHGRLRKETLVFKRMLNESVSARKPEVFAFPLSGAVWRVYRAALRWSWRTS